MQNPEEIEGSEARARDRGDAIGFGHFSDGGEKPFLGDPEVVEGALRSFLTDAHAVAGTAGASDKIAALIETLAGAFYGLSSSYTISAFNSHEQLGRFVNEQLGASEDDAKSVHMLLWNLVAEVFSARSDLIDDKTGDDAAKFRVDAAIDDAARILLGLEIADPE